MRIRVSDRVMERVLDMTNLPTTGNLGAWVGLSPDDPPLVNKDTGTQDIEVLDWEGP